MSRMHGLVVAILIPIWVTGCGLFEDPISATHTMPITARTSTLAVPAAPEMADVERR
jgi:hypothetical protein